MKMSVCETRENNRRRQPQISREKTGIRSTFSRNQSCRNLGSSASPTHKAMNKASSSRVWV